MSASKPRRRSQSSSFWALLLVVGLVTFGYFFSQGVFNPLLRRMGLDPAWFGLAHTAQPAVSIATDAGSLEVFFTTPELIYPDVPRNRLAPAHERALLADLRSATQSIDFASFEYNLTSLGDALVEARQRGVKVRLALDRGNLENPVMAKWAGIVEDAGIPISWEESSNFLHSKFVVIDERIVWTGSWNPTINDTYRNNNNILRSTIPVLVANYRAEFERMADRDFGKRKMGATPYPTIQMGDVLIENYFSPMEPVRDRIVAYLAEAERSVDVMAFSFTADEIGEAMIERHQAGVPVRVVFENRNAAGIGSEFDRLSDVGIDVLKDGNCYTMHHKVIIIDQRIVITGSYNFTARAENVNDENLLIINDAALAAGYQEEFARVYAQAQNPLRCN